MGLGWAWGGGLEEERKEGKRARRQRSQEGGTTALHPCLSQAPRKNMPQMPHTAAGAARQSPTGQQRSQTAPTTNTTKHTAQRNAAKHPQTPLRPPTCWSAHGRFLGRWEVGGVAAGFPRIIPITNRYENIAGKLAGWRPTFAETTEHRVKICGCGQV